MLSSVMLLMQLLSSAEAGSRLQLSTAYLNLARRFEQELGALSDVSAASMLLRSAFIPAINWFSRHHGRCCLVHLAIWCTEALVASACATTDYVDVLPASTQRGPLCGGCPAYCTQNIIEGIQLSPMVLHAAAGGH